MSKRTDRRRNGLQIIKSLGVPEGVVSALILLLATVTALPYLAGREFGPYTVPDLLPPSTFWSLTLTTPLVWIALLGRLFGPPGSVTRKTVLAIIAVECVAALIAFGTSPVCDELVSSYSVAPGQQSGRYRIVLPTAQRIELTVVSLSGLKSSDGVMVEICGADSEKNCISEQKGAGATIARYLPKGAVSVSFYNFTENAVVANITFVFKYCRRRYY